MGFRHLNKKKSSYQCTSTYSVRGIVQQLAGLKPLDIYLGGHLKLPDYTAPNENEESLHQRIFTPVKPFATTPGPSKQRESTCSDVLMTALI